MYKEVKSDFLIQSDADVVYENANVFKGLIKAFVKDNKVMMCGGNSTPIEGRTFIEKAVACTFSAYTPLRFLLKNGNNKFSVDGKLVAYKKHFYKTMKIPTTMIGNDIFTYFLCISQGYKYKFVPSSIVNFRFPTTIKDQIRQNTRYVAAHIRYEKYFDKELVRTECAIPLSIKYYLISRVFMKNPIECISIFLINVYSKMLAQRDVGKLNGKWQIIKSTKESISV